MFTLLCSSRLPLTWINHSSNKLVKDVGARRRLTFQFGEIHCNNLSAPSYVAYSIVI